MNALWHMRIKSQCIGDDIRSPPTKVGTEKENSNWKSELHTTLPVSQLLRAQGLTTWRKPEPLGTNSLTAENTCE